MWWLQQRRAGREWVRSLVQRWLEIRRITVAAKTYRADQDLPRLMPTGLLALQVSAVSGREVARSFESLLAAGLAEGSVVRYRATLGVLQLVRPREGHRRQRGDRRAGAAPVRRAEEMDPFSEAELEDANARWHEASPRLADILLLVTWTGLRWAEARSLRIEDRVEVPTPGLLVRRSQPEGGAVKSTKGRSSRRVPLANRVLPIALRLREGKAHGELYSRPTAASTPAPSRRGWATSRSARRTATCTSSAAAPIWPARSGSTPRRGTPGGHIGVERANDNDETPPDVARLRWSDGVSRKWS